MHITLKVIVLIVSTMYLAIHTATSAVAANTRPFIPTSPVETDSADFDRFKHWVDQAESGRPGYNFSAYEAALMYRIAKDYPKLDIDAEPYAKLAISMVDSYVKAAETAVAQGNRPEISGDSYLHIGPQIRSLAATYDWLYDQLTPEQRTHWEIFAEQAIWNVWNHQNAKWGNNPFPWSGWSRDNPGNNYYYSFVTATMLWGLASQNKTWLDYVRKNRLPLLVTYFNKIPGGGSQEGTGYGTSHMELFRMYREWRDATGEDLSKSNPHCRESIDYWIHATVPTLDRFAPIGDQSRDSTAQLYDYHEHLMLEAVYLNKDKPEAARGNWWLKHNSVDRISNGFNLHKMIIRQKITEAAPTTLIYYAKGTGHLFSRSSWDKDATWMSFVAGPYVESHAHQDQGAFSIYNEKWLAVTENIHSHSGIHQDVDVHNVVAFMRNGKPIPQAANSHSKLTYTDVDGVLTIQADLSNAYYRSSVIAKWTRQLVFNRSAHTFRVHDKFNVSEGVEPVWQINVPNKPKMTDEGVRAGNLLIKPITPKQPQIEILEWSSLDSAEYRSGWKIMLRGGTEYVVDMVVDD